MVQNKNSCFFSPIWGEKTGILTFSIFPHFPNFISILSTIVQKNVYNFSIFNLSCGFSCTSNLLNIYRILLYFIFSIIYNDTKKIPQLQNKFITMRVACLLQKYSLRICSVRYFTKTRISLSKIMCVHILAEHFFFIGHTLL